ncbi:acetyl esterase/lipase [Streptomyces griseochromogenes]|uniref:Acetyl esterase/lipase n=1 Tax=Streptomyces griseochromogenes TaxID=68214 RepID=A0A1B1AWH5_9ACTN|nr:alpha/beta hydrolase fold domain-containing protein [Streptomyces griseochromogenes]ANP50913.1 hypothetical protein AVL59_15935 [Streptomyces griseochromogenes]MBP2052176.1 acetyl esterase/lipase [Streptomyces griseochromogenes]
MTCTSQIEGPLPAQRQLVTRRLCRDVGAVVAAVHYRRSPGHPFPAPYDDCLAAARHVADSVTDYGARRDRLAVAGDSAGANLAAVIAQTFRDEHRPLAAQLLAYPPTDSDGDYPSRTQNATGYMLTSENIADIQYLYAGNDPVVVTTNTSPPAASRLIHGFLNMFPVSARAHAATAELFAQLEQRL